MSHSTGSVSTDAGASFGTDRLLGEGRLSFLFGETVPDALFSDFIFSSDGRVTFAGPSDHGGGGFFPSLAFDDAGRLHLSGTTGYWSIWYWYPIHMVSEDGGLSFSGWDQLDDLQWVDLQETSIATAGALVGVVADRPQYPDVALTVSEDGGNTFPEWFPVSDGPRGTHASLAFDEIADAYVTWTDSRTGSPQVWFDRGTALLTTGVAESGVGTATPARLRVDVTPNPSAGTVRFAVSAPAPPAPASSWQGARLTIHDVRGREVQRFEGVEAAGREVSLRWDGTDRAGAPVGPGVYFATFAAGGEIATARFLMVR